jgi:hypothetical protein
VFDLNFLGKPLSIPKSAKKFDDFGAEAWLYTFEPPESNSDDWTLSTYSKREVKDGLADTLLFVVDGTGAGGSSGFWS